MSNYYDNYINKILLDGNTISDQLNSNQQHYIDSTFLDSPTVKTVKLNGQNIVVRVIGDKEKIKNKPTDDLRKIIFQDINQVINMGDIFEFDNNKWITIDRDYKVTSCTCKVERCNHILKFYNEFGFLIEKPCIATNQTLYSLGVIEDNTMITPKSKLSVLMINDKDTIKINRDCRFIVDNTAWKVTDVNKLRTGLISLLCAEIQSESGDDLVNQIPFNESIPITISFPKTSYDINIGNTLQLQPIITQGNAILNLSVKYTLESVNNQVFVNVDNLGNVTGIKVGAGKVICSLIDNSDVRCEVNVEVTSNVVLPSDLYTYSIEGNDILKKTVTATFTGKVFFGGSEVSNKQYNFRIANYTGVDPSLITMTVVDEYSVKIKSNSNTGTILLFATLKDDNTKLATKTIQLKDIYGK